jgi:exosome complex RNA-binding protein Rrp4
MDDGNRSKNSYTIALCDYSIHSLELFKKFLKKKWDIEVTIRKNGIIYIKANSRKIFINLITPYVIPSMLYKLQSPHKTS